MTVRLVMRSPGYISCTHTHVGSTSHDCAGTDGDATLRINRRAIYRPPPRPGPAGEGSKCRDEWMNLLTTPGDRWP